MKFNKPGGDPEKLREQMEAEAMKWTPREEIDAAQTEDHPVINKIKGLLGMSRGPASLKSDYYDEKLRAGTINSAQRNAAVAMDSPGPHSEEEMDNADRAELAALSTDAHPDEARISELTKPRFKRKVR